MTAAELLVASRLSLRYRVLADMHLTAAERHAQSSEHVVDKRLCNQSCIEAEDPSEPHIDAAVLLGAVSASEVSHGT